MYIPKSTTLAGRPVLLQAKVPAGYGVTQVRAFYRIPGSSTFASALMETRGNDLHRLWISAATTARGLEYYLQAEASGRVLATMPESNPTANPYVLSTSAMLETAVDADAHNSFELAVGVTVEIPSGALESDTNLLVAPLTSDVTPPAGLNTTDVGFKLTMSDGTSTFAEPITLTFSYADADVTGINPANLRAYYLDDAGVIRYVGGEVDVVANVVTFSTTHFTEFFLAEGHSIYPAPPSSAPLGEPLVIKTSMIDYVPVVSATLFYRMGSIGGLQSLSMVPIGDYLQATIPGEAVTDAGIAYYIIGTDGAVSVTSPTSNPAVNPVVMPPMPEATPATPMPEATPAGNSGLIQPDTGGVLQSNLDTLSVLLTMPPGAVGTSAQMSVRVVESPPAVGGMQIAGAIFSITAVVEATGEPITQFSQPFTLVIQYSDEDVFGIDESKLTLHYWSEQSQTWQDIPSLVDVEKNTLTSVLDHLTVFAMLEGIAPRTSQLYLPFVALR